MFILVLNGLKRIVCLSEIESNKRFDILDGYRGLLVITVIIQHSTYVFQLNGDYLQLNMIGTFIGVPSFFVLSSFLLTFKLFSQFCKSNGSFKEIAFVSTKYLIRRFFRIYIPYVAFCTFDRTLNMYSTHIAKFYASNGIRFQSWIILIKMESFDHNHLWTVPVEIKYYFVIPIFTFITFALQRFWIIWLSSIIIIVYFTQQYNFLSLKCDYVVNLYDGSLHRLFLVFLIGSVVAVLYFKITEKNYSKLWFLEKLKYCIGYVCFAMFFYGCKQSSIYYDNHSYSCQFTYAIYWVTFMVLLLLLEENSYFLEFMNLSILKGFGKYSFGIYLLHYYGLMSVHYLTSKTLMNSSGYEKIIFTATVCYGFGFIFYHLVEVPSMNIGKYLIQKFSSAKCFQKIMNIKIQNELQLDITLK